LPPSARRGAPDPAASCARAPGRRWQASPNHAGRKTGSFPCACSAWHFTRTRILALCTLQVGPDCDEKYSRKRHRISAIAAAGAATPTPVAKNRCADPACAATDRAPIRPILVSASSRKLEFFVPAGPRANNDRIKVSRPPLSGHTALPLRASSSQEAARSRHPRSRAFGASIAFANGADGTCKRDLGKWVDEQREAFPWP
jgi:hypothetical protein